MRVCVRACVDAYPLATCSRRARPHAFFARKSHLTCTVAVHLGEWERTSCDRPRGCDEARNSILRTKRTHSAFARGDRGPPLKPPKSCVNRGAILTFKRGRCGSGYLFVILSEDSSHTRLVARICGFSCSPLPLVIPTCSPPLHPFLDLSLLPRGTTTASALQSIIANWQPYIPSTWTGIYCGNYTGLQCDAAGNIVKLWVRHAGGLVIDSALRNGGRWAGWGMSQRRIASWKTRQQRKCGGGGLKEEQRVWGDWWGRGPYVVTTAGLRKGPSELPNRSSLPAFGVYVIRREIIFPWSFPLLAYSIHLPSSASHSPFPSFASPPPRIPSVPSPLLPLLPLPLPFSDLSGQGIVGSIPGSQFAKFTALQLLWVTHALHKKALLWVTSFCYTDFKDVGANLKGYAATNLE